MTSVLVLWKSISRNYSLSKSTWCKTNYFLFLFFLQNLSERDRRIWIHFLVSFWSCLFLSSSVVYFFWCSVDFVTNIFAFLSGDERLTFYYMSLFSLMWHWLFIRIFLISLIYFSGGFSDQSFLLPIFRHFLFLIWVDSSHL